MAAKNAVYVLALLLLVAAPAWAASSDIHVTGAWTRVIPAGAGSTAVYFTIVNSGAAPDRLTGADSPVAMKAELHQSMSMHAMMEMKPSGPVDVAAGATVIFKPLGRHLMLMGMKQRLYEGGAFALTLHFEHAGAITVPVETVALSQAH